MSTLLIVLNELNVRFEVTRWLKHWSKINEIFQIKIYALLLLRIQ